MDIYGSTSEGDFSNSPASGYDAETLQIVYSSTKAITSAVMAQAVDRGLLNYDDKVALHWPEFAAAGKQDMTVADVLRHDAVRTYAANFYWSGWFFNLKLKMCCAA